MGIFFELVHEIDVRRAHGDAAVRRSAAVETLHTAGK